MSAFRRPAGAAEAPAFRTLRLGGGNFNNQQAFVAENFGNTAYPLIYPYHELPLTADDEHVVLRIDYPGDTPGTANDGFRVLGVPTAFRGQLTLDLQSDPGVVFLLTDATTKLSPELTTQPENWPDFMGPFTPQPFYPAALEQDQGRAVEVVGGNEYGVGRVTFVRDPLAQPGFNTPLSLPPLVLVTTPRVITGWSQLNGIVPLNAAANQVVGEFAIQVAGVLDLRQYSPMNDFLAGRPWVAETAPTPGAWPAGLVLRLKIAYQNGYSPSDEVLLSANGFSQTGYLVDEAKQTLGLSALALLIVSVATPAAANSRSVFSLRLSTGKETVLTPR